VSRLWRIVTMWAVIAALAAVSVSCNTIRGAGKDIERAGEKVQDAASD